MQTSHFLKVYPFEQRPSQLFLFSTRKASKVVISEKTYEAMECGTLSPSDEALLSDLGMIVDDRENEKRVVLNLIDEINAKNTGLNITAVLNLDCNFACTYCYEDGMKGKYYMSDRTAERLIDFAKEKINGGKKALIMDFYGGEPLLSTGLIKSISQELSSLTQTIGCSYGFTLVTNGSLFKREVAEELVPLGLESVKITLDGPAEIHNTSRPFKSGAGSFDVIINNIKETCDLVKIGIGGNFERNNYEKFVHLLDYLEAEGLTPDKIAGIKFDPVANRPQGDTSPAGYKEGCMSINEPWLSGAESLLRREILERGYNTHKHMPLPCVIQVRDSYVVNFDGVIYKCPAFIGKEGFEVGDLRTGVGDYADSYKLDIWKNEDCIECEYLPLCFGGCRYMTFVRDGSIDKLDCQKGYLDSSLETSVKQDITYGNKS